ncbi:hypothetical protein V2J09_003861 [Rumex salicifolius]
MSALLLKLIQENLNLFGVSKDGQIGWQTMSCESVIEEEKWQKVMNAEIDTIERNDTRELCNLPKGHKTIGVKWYVRYILKRVQMKDCNPVNSLVECCFKIHKDLNRKKVGSTLYKQMVGSLMYLTATRPDIMYVVSLISSLLEKPTALDMLVAKRIILYLQGTKDFGLNFKKGDESDLLGFTNSNYVGEQDDRKSTLGYHLC